MIEKHLTVQELAEREGVPVSTVRQWNYKGSGPRFMRIGKFVRYRLGDVEQWERSRLVAGRGARGET
jgi:excisionase family DNA binding protein